MQTSKWVRGLLAAAASVVVGILAAIWPAVGKEPASPEGKYAVNERDETVSGRVERLLKNGKGDVDGLALEKGAEVHFPPHIGREVEKVVKPGDPVEVDGRQKTRPEGEKVFEATQIRSQGKTIEVRPPHAGPPHGGPSHRRDEPPMKATGKVSELATNPHGDLDGLVLADGTEVKFPPHQSKELGRLVAVGDEVRVEGRRHETPKGDVHLHADVITALASGKSLERDEKHGPPPKKGEGKHHDEPKGKKGPSHKGEGKKGEHQKDEEKGPPPHEEILREVREIRRLLEAKQGK